MTLARVALVAVSLVAPVACDLLWRRVPSIVVAVTLALVLVSLALLGEWTPRLEIPLSALVGLLVGMFTAIALDLPSGDLKTMMIVGALAGPAATLVAGLMLACALLATFAVTRRYPRVAEWPALAVWAPLLLLTVAVL